MHMHARKFVYKVLPFAFVGGPLGSRFPPELLLSWKTEKIEILYTPNRMAKSEWKI